jgi:hypothetical protein
MFLFAQLLTNLHHPPCLVQKTPMTLQFVHVLIQLLRDQGTCASYLLFLESDNDVINHCNNYDIPFTIH